MPGLVEPAASLARGAGAGPYGREWRRVLWGPRCGLWSSRGRVGLGSHCIADVPKPHCWDPRGRQRSKGVASQSMARIQRCWRRYQTPLRIARMSARSLDFVEGEGMLPLAVWAVDWAQRRGAGAGAGAVGLSSRRLTARLSIGCRAHRFLARRASCCIKLASLQSLDAVVWMLRDVCELLVPCRW